MVYVLDKEGKPLMPTKRHGWVRRALRDGKAVVRKRTPFTIQLTYESGHETQDITLGVDAGSKHIGLSASTEKEELYASEVELRTDVPENLATRREAGRARRSRKTRYRAPRFSNRKRGKGWAAPSIQHRIDCHLNRIAFVHSILPVTRIIVETAAFDTQKLKAEEAGLALPKGSEYQSGDQMGFWNVREYVLFRDGHKCVHCGKKNVPLNVHHLESRKTGGNAPNNLVTLCEDCHHEFHSLSPEDQKKWNLPKRGKPYRDAAFMGIMRRALYERLKEICPVVSMTCGYITKNTRIRLGLGKSHVNDAFCIAGNLSAEPLAEYWSQKKVRRHNRQIHKFKVSKGGVRKRNQAPYIVRGFRLFDKVLYKGQVCFITGRRSSGYFLLMKLDGTAVHKSAKASDLTLLERCRGYMQNKEVRQFLSHLPLRA